MSVSKSMKSSSLYSRFVVNQPGSHRVVRCHLSIIIKPADRGGLGRRSKHSDSWPYNKDFFVCIDSSKSLDQKCCRAAVEESYNLNYTELHCTSALEREQTETDRDMDRDMDEQRRTDITGNQEKLSFKLWKNTVPCRQRVVRGGGLN